MTFPLTWNEAEELAISGSAIRRDGWTDHWICFQKSLWWKTDSSGTLVEVVTTGDIQAADLLALDWTTDPLGTVRDVCTLPTPVQEWLPPQLGITAYYNSVLQIVLTIGASSPPGNFSIQIFVNGTLVNTGTSSSGTTYEYDDASPPGSVTSVVAVVASTLPLPAWSGTVSALLQNGGLRLGYVLQPDGTAVMPQTSWGLSGTTAPLAFTVVETITNRFSTPKTVTISGVVDDDVTFNGAVYQPDAYIFWVSNPVGHKNGAHSFTYTGTLAPGASIVVGNQDNGGGGWITATATLS